MKKAAISIILVVILLTFSLSAHATEVAYVYPYDVSFESFWASPASVYTSSGDAKGLCLMEFSTGEVLFEENSKARLPIASVTKITTMLLTVEAIDGGKIKLDDEVTVSAHAASMGGSQIFLEENEKMSVHELLKSVAVASANDATVALAEYICGSEETFINEMNSRAAALGCENTHYVNTNGLPEEGHYSCAYDVALLTRELMRHPLIFDYTKIWMDTVRGGTFGLANTNRLIRFYKGATGMKTGFTSEAGYCLSGTAERDGMALIAVVLGASTSEKRFKEAKSMLDYGFSTKKLIKISPPELPDLKVSYGKSPFVALKCEEAEFLIDKGVSASPEFEISIPEAVEAPITEGASVGTLVIKIGDCSRSLPILAASSVEKADFLSVLKQIILKILNAF